MAERQEKSFFAPGERSTPKQIEKRVKTVARYLSDNRLLSSIFEAMNEIVMILDENRQAVYVNRALATFLSCEKIDDLYGKRPGEIFQCVYAAECELGCGTSSFCVNCKGVQAILAAIGGKRGIEECTIHRRKGGSTLNLSVVAVPMTVEDEKFILFVVRDISAQKRFRELERIFFHDVLNLSTVIWGMSDILREGHIEKSKEYGEKIYRAVRRLVDEIQIQKELLQAESNELTVSPEAVGSMDIIRQIILFYENHDVARGKQIAIDTKTQNIVFQSDATLLQRVIGNMLKNALEATQHGGTVVIGGCKTDGMVEFWVHNDTFMTEEVRQQVFKRSFSTKEKGRGLGTYSMKLLTEGYLNGVISFESTPAKGTTFYVRLPMSMDMA